MNKKILSIFVFSLFIFGSTKVLASLTFSNNAITGTTASSIDVGAGNTLSLQTTNNAPITTGTGLVTLGGSLSTTGGVIIGNTGGADNSADLSVDKNSANSIITATTHGAGVVPLIQMLSTRGTHASKSAVQNGDELGELQWYGFYDTVAGQAATIIAKTTQTWSNGGGGGSKLEFQTQPNGSYGPVAALTLGQDQSATFTGIVKASNIINSAYNLAFGSAALLSGQNDVPPFGAIQNTAIGISALQALHSTSGSGLNNTALGYQAGYSSAGNTAYANVTGFMNTYLGAQTGASSVTQVNNSTMVGFQALASADNQVVLGNAGVTEVQAGMGGTAKVTAKGMQYKTGTRPTCDSSSKGTIWYVAGGAGVADTIEMCGKSAADTYSWVALGTF